MNYYEFLKVLSPHGEASFSGQYSASFLRFLRKNIKHSEINGNASAIEVKLVPEKHTIKIYKVPRFRKSTFKWRFQIRCPYS